MLFILFVLLLGAAFSSWKAEKLSYNEHPFRSERELLYFRKLSDVFQVLFAIASIIVGILLIKVNFWLVILGIVLIASPGINAIVVLVANFVFIYPIVLPLTWIASKLGSLSANHDETQKYPKQTIFTNKYKIAPDIANTLYVFYKIIKRDQPNLEGERLYYTVLQTWNLNISIRHIETKELMEKAKHSDWGQDLSLRKIAWVLAVEEYVKFSSHKSVDKSEKRIDEIIKMRDQIGKIIPEGV